MITAIVLVKADVASIPEVAEAIARREPEKAAAASDRLIAYIESFARATL